jgi:hypothetical protein
MVNARTPQGQRLLEDVLSGKAKFPNQVAKDLTLCKLLAERFSSSTADKLREAAVEAFWQRPCSATIYVLFETGTILGKSAIIVEQIQRYLADFEVNQERYRRQNGYAERLRCAIIAADFIIRNYPNQKAEMTRENERFRAEDNSLSYNALW